MYTEPTSIQRSDYCQRSSVPCARYKDSRCKQTADAHSQVLHFLVSVSNLGTHISNALDVEEHILPPSPNYSGNMKSLRYSQFAVIQLLLTEPSKIPLKLVIAPDIKSSNTMLFLVLSAEPSRPSALKNTSQINEAGDSDIKISATTCIICAPQSTSSMAPSNEASNISSKPEPEYRQAAGTDLNGKT